MRKVTRWESRNGVLHKRKVDAADMDRHLRKMEKEEVKVFLMTVYVGLDDRPESRGRRPAGSWRDGSVLYYIWACNAAFQETAIRRAVKRCLSLRKRTWMEWQIDEDMRVGKNQETVYIGEHPELKKLDAWAGLAEKDF